MKFLCVLNIIFVVTLALHLIVADFPAIRCPDASLIFPCTCKPGPFGQILTLYCVGENVTQSGIDNTVDQLHLVYPNETALLIQGFSIAETNLTSLNFNSLVNINMNFLYVEKNPSLSIIEDPAIHVLGRINVSGIRLTGGNLTDAGFGNALNYFPTEIFKFIDLRKNRMSGASSGEFLRGLSKFKKLTLLNMDENQIKRIGPDGFRSNVYLAHLSFYKNQIEEIGENAFRFEPHPPNYVDELHIALDSNSLTEDKIDVNSGLSNIMVRSRLELDTTELSTLPPILFETYVRRNNTISVYGCPIICDERVKWLKDAKDQLQNYVQNANCANDLGYTVFTSNLIP